MFSVRPFIFCHSTCSVVYSLPGVHLCRTGRQKQTQASTLWEQVIAANTNGLAVTTVLLKYVNRWSVTAGSGGDWEWYFWIMRSGGLLGLTSCEEGELENVEWTVASVFSVLDKCCRPELTIHYPFSPSFWEVMKSSRFPRCDSKPHLSWHIQRDPYSNLPHQRDSKAFVAETACWHNLFFRVLLANTVSVILNRVVLWLCLIGVVEAVTKASCEKTM